MTEIKRQDGKKGEVLFWAESKFGRNKEVVRFLIRNPTVAKINGLTSVAVIRWNMKQLCVTVSDG